MSTNSYEVELPAGMRGIVLENEHIEVTVVPEKGADIYRFVDKQTRVDVLSKTPWGFAHLAKWTDSGHAEKPADYDAKHYWLDHVPGGWQVMFPNAGVHGKVGDLYYPHHGEAGTIPWKITGCAADGEKAMLSLQVDLRMAPLSIMRTFTLEAGGHSFSVRESVQNRGAHAIPFAWGQHPSFGYPFVDEGTIIEISAGSVQTHDADHEVKKIPPSGKWKWPTCTLKSGEPFDLSVIPPRVDKRWELLYLSDLEQGAYAIINPKLRLKFQLEWPLKVWPYVWLWEEMGGTDWYPYFGEGYVLGLEPCSNSTVGIEQAMSMELVHTIGPNEIREVEYKASLTSI